ncbi:ubiE/COQ5 methyltransferase [Mactra antiquata]
MTSHDVKPALRTRKENMNHIFNTVGPKPNEVTGYYDKWANEYDKQHPTYVYSGPSKLAQAVGNGLTEQQKSTMKVLDVAAGTGLVAIYLKQQGFQHIDALEPSEKMLEEAKAKNLYEKYINDYITEKPLNIEENTYDIITACGALGLGHIPDEALYEMIRLVKAGGRVALATSTEYTERIKSLEKLMDHLEQMGKWKNIVTKIVPDYVDNIDGKLYVFQIN